MSKKASLAISAALLSATIILLSAAVIFSGQKISITGASIYQPAIPSYCYNNVDACINLNGDSVIDSNDEAIFAKLLDGTITNATLKHYADFDNDSVITNAKDFQKCFVPLKDFYLDIYDGKADCNLPKGRFTEPNLSKCMHGCPDLDGNGYVDNDDYSLFFTLIGNDTSSTYYPTADLSGDGFIGTEDKSCMSLFYGRIVTCNMPNYFKHTNSCPDLTDSFGVGNDGYVDSYDLSLFNSYLSSNNLKADFNGDGTVNDADRVVFNQYYEKVVDCNIYHAPWHTGGMHLQNIKSDNTYAKFGGAYNLSQSFIPNCQHDTECQLTKIRLHLKNVSGGLSEVKVDVYDSNLSGGPNQTYIIATAAVQPSFEYNQSRWITISFNNPPNLEKGKMYHLVASSPNSPNNSYAWYYNNASPKNISYAASASWHGEGPDNYSGYSVAAGDINKDGYDDIIIGAYNNAAGKGKIYVIFGPESGNYNLNTADVKVTGEFDGDQFGYALSSGDINKDGYDDIIVSAPYYNVSGSGNDEGAVYVINGPIAAGTYTINSIYDTKWHGRKALEQVGSFLKLADINNDGYDDMLIGSPYDSTSGADGGAVYIIYGPDYSNNQNLTLADTVIYSEGANDYLGENIALGDLNKDSQNDLIIGAPSEDTGGNNAGAAYVVYGPMPSGKVNISAVYDAKYYGEGASNFSGSTLASGDLNKDGYADLVVGTDGGRLYVLFGKVSGTSKLDSADVIFDGQNYGYYNGVAVADIDYDNFDDLITASYNSNKIYAINGPLEAGRYNINSAAGAILYSEQPDQAMSQLAVGNFNKDSYNDFLVGSFLYDQGAASNAGKTYLIQSPLARNINGSFWNQTPSSGWVQSADSDFLFQLWLSSACADLNDDGICNSVDENFILGIPDGLMVSGTPGWNEAYDLNDDGKIDSADSAYLSQYLTNPQTNITKSVSCELSTGGLGFGNITAIAQPFRANQNKIYYADLYLKLENGSGTEGIKVEIRSATGGQPLMSGLALASATLGPITSPSYASYRAHFEAPATIIPSAKYFIVVSSPSSVYSDEYMWRGCGNPGSNELNATVGVYNSTLILWQWNLSSKNMSFIVYKGNNDSISPSLDINNDKAVNATDYNLVQGSVGNWSGEIWTGKVDFNAQFGVYEKLKDYTLGFKAYLNKVVTCGLLNWPEGDGNGRCDVDAPYNENYTNSPSDCPACNYDNFCSVSEDPNNCTDCTWQPVTALYSTRSLKWSEDANYTIDISAWFNDPDNDSSYFFTYLTPSHKINVSLNTATGSAKLMPGRNFFGAEYVNFSATDGLSTAYVTTTLNVTNVDDAPYLKSNIPNMAWPEDVINKSLNLSAYFGEYDFQALAYSVILTPSNIAYSINQTTGIVTLTPSANWSGTSKIRFKAADPGSKYANSNNVTLNVTPVNDVPYMISAIPNQSSVMGRNITINMSIYFADVEGSELNYTAINGTNVTILIDNQNKTVKIVPDSNWNGTSWVMFTANDTLAWSNSNNVSLYFALGESILISSRIDGALIPNGNYTSFNYIIVSNLTRSNVTSSSYLFRSRLNSSYVHNSSLTNSTIMKSTIINSTFIRCNVENSTVKNYYGTDCTIHNSEIDPVNQNNVTGSTIVGNSRIMHSNVTFSYVSSSNITSSGGTNSSIIKSRIDNSQFDNCSVNSSFVIDSKISNCTIVNGTIYTGIITTRGITYDATASGEKNLTDIINYYPTVSLSASSTSIYTGSSVTFTINSDDLNLGGALETDLLHTWYPGTGNKGIFYPNRHQTWNRSFNGTSYAAAADSKDSVISSGTNGSGKIFTIKYSLNGTHLWNKSFSSWNSSGRDIAIDSQDNIIIAGILNETGHASGIIIKYNSAGSMLWSSQYYNPSMQAAFFGVDSDLNGNIIASGRINGSSNYTLLVKYNSSGSKLWENLTSGVFGDSLNEVKADSSNSLIAAGRHNGTESAMKFSPEGMLSWKVGYNVSEGGFNAVALDSSNYAYALAGSSSTTSCFVAKISPSGQKVSNFTINFTSNTACNDIYLDSSSNILISASDANQKFTVMKFSSSYASLWNVSYNSSSVDSAYGIASDSYNNIISSGKYNNESLTVKLKPSPGYPNTTITQLYSTAGNYNASIMVKDSFNETDSDAKSITVSVYSPPPSGGRSGGGGGGGAAACAESWSCTEWGECGASGLQFRTCTDARLCGTYNYMPSESQACDYTPTCSDFVLNQDESDVDCGGSCQPCINGKSCLTDSDCTNKCIGGICAAEAPPAPVAQPPARPTPPPPPAAPPVQQPAEISFWQTEVFGLSMWIIIMASAGALFLLTGGVIAFTHKKKPAEPIAAAMSESPTYAYLDSLRAAIKRDVVRGVPETEIRQALVEIGWPAGIISQAIREINRAVLAEPVSKSITRGYNEVKLKNALVEKGWPESTVDDVIHDVNISILKKAIKNQLSKGMPLESITAGMVERGWPESTVASAAEEFNYAK